MVGALVLLDLGGGRGRSEIGCCGRHDDGVCLSSSLRHGLAEVLGGVDRHDLDAGGQLGLGVGSNDGDLRPASRSIGRDGEPHTPR